MFQAETEGMLLSNGVDIRDFSTEVIKSLPVTEENFVIDEVLALILKNSRIFVSLRLK